MGFHKAASRLLALDRGGMEYPLVYAVVGETVEIQRINGGKKISSRLSALGLHPGARVRVIKSSGSGPLILAVKQNSRLALGRGMAHKLIIKEIQCRRIK